MSVINQMLKDLDNRHQHETQHNVSQHHTILSQQKSGLLWVMLIALILVVNVIVWYLWQGKNLSAAQQPMQATQVAASATPFNSTQQIKRAEQPQTASSAVTPVQAESIAAQQLVSAVKSLMKQQEQVLIKLASQQQEPLAQKKEPDNQPQNVQVPTTEENQVVASKQQPASHETDHPSHTQTIQDKHVLPKEEPSLTIKRVELTSEQLISQKLAEAELAVQENKPEQAEQAFADVLLLEPKHLEARQKLAALWYGRKAYQAALNTLAQGISIMPEAYQLRFMQARIYLIQGQAQQALDSLLAQTTNDIDYLAMQAGLAQQLSQFKLAEQSYQQLTQIAASNAKWWLGYAIALDSQQQYASAQEAYQQALDNQGLSPQNRQFVQQRREELRN